MLLSGCFSTTSNNLMFDGTSCEITCELTWEPGDGFLNIQRIELILAGGNASSIVSIDGTLYTTPTGPPMPFFMNSGNPTTEVVFSVSAPAAIGQVDNLILEVEHGFGPGGGIFSFPIALENVNPLLYWTPPMNIPYDFGTLPVGSSAQTTFNFTNPTICDAEFYLNFNGDDCDGLSFLNASPWIVPSGTNSDLTIDWSPTSQANLDCEANISLGENRFIVPIEGNAIVPSGCLSCVDITIKTEQDFLPSINGVCNDFIADGRFDRATIGGGNTVVFEFYYANGLADGVELWFNPELFNDICDFAAKYSGGFINSAPPVAWYVSYFSGMGTVNMTLAGAGAATNSQKNVVARFVEGASPNEFSVEFDFFFTFDLNDWLTSLTQNNQQRLLRNSNLSTTDFTNTVQSVYNTIRKACFFFYLRDPNVLVPDPLTGGNVAFTCYEEKSIKTTARFYNSGILGDPSEFQNPTLVLERSGNPVTDFSSFSETTAIFTVDAPTIFDLDNCVFWLIDATNFNNSTDFRSNYDSSRAEIVTSPGGILDNHIKGPSVAPTNIGGQTFEVRATIDNTVSPGQEFYLIAVTYSAGALVPNSFIFGPFQVTDQPGIEDVCCELDTSHIFGNYNRNYLIDCYRPTVKERINCAYAIQGGDFASECLVSFGLSPDKVNDWVQLVKSIDLLIYREVVDFPNLGQTTTFVFGQYRSERTAGFPGNWNNLNPPFVVQDGGPNQIPEPLIQTYFETRVRYEEDVVPSTVLIANNSTPYNRTPAGPLGATYASTNGITYDWADEEIFFEYIVTFDVGILLGIPFESKHVKRTKIIPYNFEAERGFVGLNDVKFYYPDPNIPSKIGDEIFGPFCITKATHIFVETSQTILNNNMNLIATIDRVPTGISNLVEEESYLSPQSLPLTQLDSNELFDVDTVFAGGKAYFKIDLSQLDPGKYQVCSIGLVI